MLSFLYRLVTSVWPHKRVYAATNTIVDLEDEWIAIVSDTETKLTSDERNQVDDELAFIRKRNSRNDRAFILGRVNEAFSKHDLSDLTRVVLPADLRQRIYKDVLTELSPDWIAQIKRIYPSLSSLESNWTPSTYEKNLLGQMIDMAERTGPDHLSAPGFAQMIKGVHLCLIQSLALMIEVPVTPSDSEVLLEMLVKAIVPIIDLWLPTARNSQNALTRQGKLPSKWAHESEVRQNQLDEKKARGEIDARFIDGDPDELRRKYVTNEKIIKGLLVSHETMAERQALLRRQLYSTRIPVTRPVESDVVINFKERQAQLERLLKK